MSKSPAASPFCCVAALVAAYFVFDLGRYFSLDYFKAQQAAIDAWYRASIRGRPRSSTF